jgi:uncharacterized damage-inducible protein DinB
MTRRVGLVLLFVCTAALAGTPARAQTGNDSPLLGPLKQNWESIRTNVVRTAEIVPEDKYDFKPTPGVRSFRDQFVHIIEENYFFMGFVTGQRNQKPAGNLRTKAEIVKALTESYDNETKALAGINDRTALEMVPMMGNRQGPRWSAALVNIVDNMDHYGNLVVYLRLNGIVPPSSQPRQPQR